jgi:plastocyanin
MRLAFVLVCLALGCSSEDRNEEPADEAGTGGTAGAAGAENTAPGLCKCPLTTKNEPKLVDPVVTAAGTAESGSFSPRCFAIAPGTSVTFSGDFSVHPTEPNPSSDPGNPIPSVDSGTSFQVTFPDEGEFGFHCAVHGTENFGMCGAVFVVP